MNILLIVILVIFFLSFLISIVPDIIDFIIDSIECSISNFIYKIENGPIMKRKKEERFQRDINIQNSAFTKQILDLLNNQIDYISIIRLFPDKLWASDSLSYCTDLAYIDPSHVKSDTSISIKFSDYGYANLTTDNRDSDDMDALGKFLVNNLKYNFSIYRNSEDWDGSLLKDDNLILYRTEIVTFRRLRNW